MIQEVDPYALSKCRTIDELTEWLDRIVAELAKPPELPRYLPRAERRNDGVHQLCPIALAAAVRIATTEGIAEPVPLDDADPLRAILRLRQWCARATSAATQPEPENTGWEVPWNPADPTYIGAREAREKFSDGKPSEVRLSKLLGTIPVHFMRAPGKGSRVHVTDYRQWSAKTFPSNSAEIADEYIADLETRKAEARARKPRA